jgi:hypothetical protein
MIPPAARLTHAQRAWLGRSRRQEFNRPDTADEQTFNRIIWRPVKGAGRAYPGR